MVDFEEVLREDVIKWKRITYSDRYECFSKRKILLKKYNRGRPDRKGGNCNIFKLEVQD